LFVLLVFGLYCLDVSLLEKIQDYEEKTLSSSKREARQVTLDHFDHMCSLFSLVHILACMLYYCYLRLIPLGFGLSYLVSYAELCSFESHTSLSILCDVEFGLCLCESVVVVHPSRCEMTV
jgi:hypothetical protein